MIPKFFGQYLLERDTVSKDQLIEAIKYQQSKVLKLGEIALMKGYLTDKQIAQIHNEQRRTDMMFGELAIKMKLLSETQLGEIMTIQKNSHIYLGEALVALGYLNTEQLDKELAAFKEEQKAVPPIEVMIAEDIENKETVTISVDVSIKMMRRIGDMLSKMGQLRYETDKMKNLGVASTIRFKGDLNFTYILNATWNVAHQVARKTFKNDTLPFDMELIADTMSEFVNVVCGNVKAKALESGKRLEIVPPVTYMDEKDKDIPLEAGQQAIVVPTFTPIGEIEIALVFGK